MRHILLAVSLLLRGTVCVSQESTSGGSDTLTFPVVIEASNAKQLTPVCFIDIDKSQLNYLNSGQDMPYLLRLTPSLVATSDAGTGIGYTGLWIRGSDPTRINVTINGIPLNDSESQQVYWVDLPDLASGTDGIQIQRGIGTSIQGNASFGGTIRIETHVPETTPFAKVIAGGGSYNTLRNSIQFGTGLLPGNVVVEGRFSRTSSDGYIDRASAALHSFFIAGNYISERTNVGLTVLSGHERTYQAWAGTPESKLAGDDQAMMSYAERNGLTSGQTGNLLSSGRSYNYYQYNNEVDDYSQDHYQIRLDQLLAAGWTIQATAHFTKGKGYYEQFRENDELGAYGLNDILVNQGLAYSDDTTGAGDPWSSAYAAQYGWNEIDLEQNAILDENGNPVLDADGNTLLAVSASIKKSDVIRRRWLDNHVAGSIVSLTWQRSRLETTLGFGFNRYDGSHYGELVWMEHPSGSFSGDHYYDGEGVKRDGNMYVQSNYHLNRWTFFGDIQWRKVNYETSGKDNDLRSYQVEDDLLFFNPKFGLSYQSRREGIWYGSVAAGSHEPNRNDYVDAVGQKFPSPERMTDLEFGYRRSKGKVIGSVNAFYMNYRNQLVLDGSLNDVGAPLRINVPISYRTGLEAEISLNDVHIIDLQVSATVSDHRIQEFHEVIYDYTDVFQTETNVYRNVPISFSPRTVVSALIGKSFGPARRGMDSGENFVRPFRVALLPHYVGKQYLDNTGNGDRIIEPYLVADLKLDYGGGGRRGSQLEGVTWQFYFQICNVLNSEYSSNGYTYSYRNGDIVTERFYYPQAPIHFMAGITIQWRQTASE